MGNIIRDKDDENIVLLYLAKVPFVRNSHNRRLPLPPHLFRVLAIVSLTAVAVVVPMANKFH